MPPATPPPVVATRTRVKWDNIGFVVLGLAVLALAIAGVFVSQAAPTTTPKPQQSEASTTQELTSVVNDGSLTIEDANGLVEEAKNLMADARWAEAADRLAAIPTQFRDMVGAPAIEQDLELRRTQHDTLRAELIAAVEARSWKQAQARLDAMRTIAPLDAGLLDIQAQVERGIAADLANAKRATAAAAAKNPVAPASPVAATTTKPTATPKPAPKPAATTPKPGTNTQAQAVLDALTNQLNQQNQAAQPDPENEIVG